MRTLTSLRLGLIGSLTLLASCGGDPANVAGTYTINLTSGPNGCELEGWTEGATTSAVPVVITQDGSSVTVTVQGVAAGYLDLVVGSHVFEGAVSGDHIDAMLTGRTGSEGSCAFTQFVALDADLDGDVLTGALRWYAQTNGLEECGILNSCENTQQLNGARPPSSGS